jgi:hypothetical protein
MGPGGELMVAYTNDMDDIKALPQIVALKAASTEIRQLLNDPLNPAGHSACSSPSPELAEA